MRCELVSSTLGADLSLDLTKRDCLLLFEIYKISKIEASRWFRQSTVNIIDGDHDKMYGVGDS